MHGEWDLPLSGLGGGNIFVDNVVAPIAHKRRELIVDLINADKRAPD